jgi:hypothetical protein
MELAHAWRWQPRRAMLGRMRYAFLGAFAIFALVACGQSRLEPLPLEIKIETSRTTAAPGDTITFVVVAQGGVLLGIDVDYGDAGKDQYGTAGARTARVTFRHAYTSRGTYPMNAMVTDGTAGQKKATVDIHIE